MTANYQFTLEDNTVISFRIIDQKTADEYGYDLGEVCCEIHVKNAYFEGILCASSFDCNGKIKDFCANNLVEPTEKLLNTCTDFIQPHISELIKQTEKDKKQFLDELDRERLKQIDDKISCLKSEKEKLEKYLSQK